MKERFPSGRTHSFRNFMLVAVGAPALIISGSAGYLYRNASDKADSELDRATRAFTWLSTAPESQQVASRLELTPNTSLLLNSIGAWVITKSAISPRTPNTVTLHVDETQSLAVKSLTIKRQAPVPLSKTIPAGTTDITLVSPVMHGAACTSDHMLTIPEIDIDYLGQPQQLTNVQLPGQCTDTNGLHGNGVTIHGVDYHAE